MIQLSILQIRGYGPWTLTLGSDREHELQVLQASIYGRLQRLFSERNCLVFPNRGDEFFAVTNGLDSDGHKQILDSLDFDVDVSVLVGIGDTPLEADRAAHKSGACSPDADEACIMHFDVENLTSRRQSRSPYETTLDVFSLYCEMSRFFLRYDSLAFFMGGDNFMVIAGNAAKKAAPEFLEHVQKKCKMRLNCGIGTASTAREAARLATESLDTIRRLRKSGKHPGIYELSC
ncbi:MAG: GTP cyclohydrolase IIa [Nitrosopumilus sp. B06]|nr:MAG: GTP cyclohydrolase IIa [Nitrosopumilus sp. D6]RNJ79654.1 MAG: GTP cyclohydrolase IIa [Nitrosopumilus sp. B06]